MDARSRCRLAEPFALVLVLSTCLATAGLAQTGSIIGVVQDEHGKPVPYANVILKNTRLGGTANADGVYRILSVPIGTYTAVTRIVGYAPAERTNLTVLNDGEVRVDFKVAAVEVRVIMTGPSCGLHTPAPPSRCWIPPTNSPDIRTSSWKRFEFEYGAFSMLLPPDSQEIRGHEIDPEVRNFVFSSTTIAKGPAVWLSVYWGIYADPLNKSERHQRYATRSEWIGGKRATLITAEWKGRGAVPDSGCVAAAAWRDVTPNLNLTIQGTALNREGMRLLLTILRTIRFDWDRKGAALPGD